MCKSSQFGDPAMHKTEWKSHKPRFTFDVLKSSDGPSRPTTSYSVSVLGSKSHLCQEQK